MEKETLFTKVLSLLCSKQLNESEWNGVLQIVSNELGEEYTEKVLNEFECDEMNKAYLMNSLNRLSNVTMKELLV